MPNLSTLSAADDLAQTTEILVRTGAGPTKKATFAHAGEHLQPITTAPRNISLTWGIHSC